MRRYRAIGSERRMKIPEAVRTKAPSLEYGKKFIDRDMSQFLISQLKCRCGSPMKELSEKRRLAAANGRKENQVGALKVHLTAGMSCSRKSPQGVTQGRSQLW